MRYKTLGNSSFTTKYRLINKFISNDYKSVVKHEATRYERAEGFSTSIKIPIELFHWLRNQRAFFFMLTFSDFLARLISELNFYCFRLRKFSSAYYSLKSQNVQPTV